MDEHQLVASRCCVCVRLGWMVVMGWLMMWWYRPCWMKMGGGSDCAERESLWVCRTVERGWR